MLFTYSHLTHSNLRKKKNHSNFRKKFRKNYMVFAVSITPFKGHILNLISYDKNWF